VRLHALPDPVQELHHADLGCARRNSTPFPTPFRNSTMPTLAAREGIQFSKTNCGKEQRGSRVRGR
jgi:hypothetical protein